MNKVHRLYRIVRGVLAIVVKPMLRITYIGRDNIPKEGPYIFLSNHYSNWDPITMAITNHKCPMHFLAKAELYENKILSFIGSRAGVIPIKRNEVDLKAMRACNKVLKEGHVLAIFPEGTRFHGSQDGKVLGEAQSGTSLFALKNHVPIVPMRIRGKYRLFGKIEVHIGEPFELTAYYNERPSGPTLEEATIELWKKVEML